MSGQKFISEAPGSGGERPFCRRLLAQWGAGQAQRSGGRGAVKFGHKAVKPTEVVTAMAWPLGCLFKECWSFLSPVAQWGSNLVYHWANGVLEK